MNFSSFGLSFLLGMLFAILFWGYRSLSIRVALFSKEDRTLFLIHISSLIGFILIFLFLQLRFQITPLEIWIYDAVRSLHSSSLDAVMMFLTVLGGPEVMFSLSFLLSAALLIFKKYKEALLFMLASLGGISSMYVLKIFLHVSRPDQGLLLESTFASPSGHAAMASIFFLCTFLVLRDGIAFRWGRLLAFFTAGFFIVSISLSRLYLGVHWLSDILGGYFLALFWITFSLLAVETFRVFMTKDYSKK